MRLIQDLSLNRIENALEGKDSYDLWFGLPPRAGKPTAEQLQVLCQGNMLVGQIGQAMGWDWPTLIRNVRHLSAPFEDYVFLEVGTRTFRSPRFRRVLQDLVPACGLDPYKVKVTDIEKPGVYILGHGLPPI